MNRFFEKINKDWVKGSLIILIVIITVNFINYFVNLVPNVNGRYLELGFFYTANDIYTLAQSYGEIGRSIYTTCALTIDILVPLTASAFLTILVIYLGKKLNKNNDVKIIILGILTCLSDWIENILLIVTLKAYPREYPVLVNSASIMTTIKYILMISFIIILIYRFYKIKKKLDKLHGR